MTGPINASGTYFAVHCMQNSWQASSASNKTEQKQVLITEISAMYIIFEREKKQFHGRK